MNGNQRITPSGLIKDKGKQTNPNSSHALNNSRILKECNEIISYNCSTLFHNRRNQTVSYFKSRGICFQLLFFYILILICLGLICFSLREWIYQHIILVDYATGHKSQYATGLIQEGLVNGLRFINIDFKLRTENQIAQMLLMKIYMRELIGKNLLQPSSFSDVHQTTDSYYKGLNNDINTTYTIDPSIAATYFNDENPSSHDNDYLNNLMIINYLFAPLMIQESGINGNQLVTTYVLPYYIDNMVNKGFTSHRYFHYPLDKGALRIVHPKGNFLQMNLLTDPNIKSDFDISVDHGDASNYFLKANWFYLKDFSFRQEEVNDSTSKSSLSFFNYAELDVTQVQRYHFSAMQFTIPKPSNPLVINLIFKYQEEYQNSKEKNFSFLIQDIAFNSNEGVKLQKYSDGTAFVITKNAISPILMSDNQRHYFTYEMSLKSNNNGLLYANGNNFNTFDLEYLNDIEAHYLFQSKMAEDIMIFKVMHFYYQITIKKRTDKSITDPGFFLYLLNYTNTEGIKELCDSINIVKYYNDLKRISNDLNCFNDYDMYYHHLFQGMDYNKKAIDYLPNCLCLPFYCLDLRKSNLDEEVYEYTKMLQLPNNCQSNYLSYYSNVNSSGKSVDHLIGANLFRNSNRVFFQFIPLPYLNSITMYNVNNIFNQLITEAEFIIVEETEQMKNSLLIYYVFVHLAFVLVFLLISSIRVYYQSKVFNSFMDIYKDFVFKAENKRSDIGLMSREDNHQSEVILNEQIDSGENKAFITVNNNNNNNTSTVTELIIKDEGLIDDLFKLFCKFNRVSKSSAMKIINKQRKEDTKSSNVKIDYLRKANELFYILSWVTQVTPEHQMNLKLDINLYRHTQLIHNYPKEEKASGNAAMFHSNFSSINKDKKEYSDISQAILCEVLSTESIFDQGIIYNVKFNYKFIIQRKAMNLKSDHFKLSEKRKDAFYEVCESEFKGVELNLINEIKSAFNYYLTKVHYDLMNHVRAIQPIRVFYKSSTKS